MLEYQFRIDHIPDSIEFKIVGTFHYEPNWFFRTFFGRNVWGKPDSWTSEWIGTGTVWTDTRFNEVIRSEFFQNLWEKYLQDNSQNSFASRRGL